MNEKTSSRLQEVYWIVMIVCTVIGTTIAVSQIEGWPIGGKETPMSTVTYAPKPIGTLRPTAIPTLGIGSTRISPVDGATMVYVPAGEFTMGSNDSDDEKPPHTVYLDAFWIDKFEVTNALYKKCVDADKCLPPSQPKSSTRDLYYGNLQYDKYPVINVSWNNVNAFCSWAGKRLPTEAEWEKAARGIDALKFPWGNTWDGTKVNSWDSNPRLGDTTAVGSYPSGATPYGALDMAGNVWEWVADWYAYYYSNTPRSNPKGPSSGSCCRALRGGSWQYPQDYVRVTYRNYFNPDTRSNNVGFRCVQ